MITGIDISGIKKKIKNEWEGVDSIINIAKSLPLEMTISPTSSSKGRFRIELPGALKDGTYKGFITFTTDKTGILLNRSFEITFSKSFPLLIIILVIIGILALIGGSVWFLWNRGYI